MTHLYFCLSDGVLHCLSLPETPQSALAWAKQLGACVAWVG